MTTSVNLYIFNENNSCLLSAFVAGESALGEPMRVMKAVAPVPAQGP